MEKNIKWVELEGKHVLFFTPYYDEMVVAEIICEEGEWWLNSSVTKAYTEYLECGTLEEAKKNVEQLLEEHYQEEANYYLHLLSAFKS